jgi:site-specific DNA-methyltransferase (adenine-specific)
MLTITNENCIDLMARYPDKTFDLAITDPPYGIGKDWIKRKSNRNIPFKKTLYENKNIPSIDYFEELFRVSKNQIIWGYNYFTDVLGPTNYLIVWNKVCGKNHVIRYSQGEIAYTSLHIPVRIFDIPWDGYRMGSETGTSKIHPHQKPIDLYKKLLSVYAQPGWKILDTHMGSGSIAIACHDLSFDLTACELDPDYYEAAMERIKRHQAQSVIDFTGAQ